MPLVLVNLVRTAATCRLLRKICSRDALLAHAVLAVCRLSVRCVQ